MFARAVPQGRVLCCLSLFASHLIAVSATSKKSSTVQSS
jgi:hypothetical protein